MAVKFLDNTGLGYFWGKIKAWCNSTFAAIAHTHTSYAVKHSYTTAANAAKNWYRIANANTSQLDTSKPIHAQFILTAYNASYDAGYYERWFVNAEVFGRSAHIIILGNSTAPFSQARVLYENTVADLDANDRPAIDIYLNYQLANGTTKIEIEEVYNQGWTFLANGQLAASSVPSGFENTVCSVRSNGVERSTYSDFATYLNKPRREITANTTLADNSTYRSTTLNCTGTITITVPNINNNYAWFFIKNANPTSGIITIHPSTTSVLIDESNTDIILQPNEYLVIHSRAANKYSIIADGRWKSQKADKATTLAGYGITDAKIANGTITLGSNSITPLTSVPSHNQASNTINAMTGYSKPSSSSTITVNDSLNDAIGKLEAKTEEALMGNNGVPIGTIVWLSTSTVPVGYLLCDGRTVGRETYPDLFNAIGTTYGVGDGSTTFNLPNLIGKFIEGGSTSGIYKDPGLPNITGTVGGVNLWNDPQPSGAFYSVKHSSNTNASGTTGTAEYRTYLNVSRLNSIYGNSDTVQPPALTLLPCIKAYSSVENISSLDAAHLENELQNLVANAITPIGTIIWLSTSSVPAKYLLCNGAAVSRTAYSELFTAIGTTYGAGDGTTTFNLPNLIDKFAEGGTVAGTVKNAGLPNITGYVNSVGTFGTWATWQEGCFKSIKNENINSLSTGSVKNDSLRTFDFNASRSNSIYGKSNTVQPPALTLLPCIRY